MGIWPHGPCLWLCLSLPPMDNYYCILMHMPHDHVMADGHYGLSNCLCNV